MTEKIEVSVTFDESRGYVGTAPGLPPITALSLGAICRRVEAAMMPDEVIVTLTLDRAARQERDQRRRGRAESCERAWPR